MAWLDRIAHPPDRESRAFHRWVWKVWREPQNFPPETLTERLAILAAELLTLTRRTRTLAAHRLTVDEWEKLDNRRLFLSGQEMALRLILKRKWTLAPPAAASGGSGFEAGSRAAALRAEWDPFAE